MENKKEPLFLNKEQREKDISALDLVNKFGTYEIQPTADTANEYPAIAQGLPKRRKNIRENQET